MNDEGQKVNESVLTYHVCVLYLQQLLFSTQKLAKLNILLVQVAACYYTCCFHSFISFVQFVENHICPLLYTPTCL